MVLAALAEKEQHLVSIFQVLLRLLVFILNFSEMRGQMNAASEKQYKFIRMATALKRRVQRESESIHEFNHLKKINDLILLAKLVRTAASFNK